MKIGIISDTHGMVTAWHKAMQIFGNADLILHAGDVLYHPPRIDITPGYDIPELVRLINTCPIPIVIARGNCDPEVYEELLEIPVLSPYAFVQFANLGIVVQHGHNLSEEQMRLLAAKYRAHIFVTGHTHLPLVDWVDGTIRVNPGSPSHPKFERNGMLTPTVGLILEGNVQVVELDTSKVVISLPLI